MSLNERALMLKPKSLRLGNKCLQMTSCPDQSLPPLTEEGKKFSISKGGKKGGNPGNKVCSDCHCMIWGV
jgi:hypothetical protein